MLSKPEHSFERVVVDLVISDLLSVVSQSRIILDRAGDIMIKSGITQETAVEQADNTLTEGFDKYVNSRSVIGSSTSLVDTGKYIPIGYYVAVFFAFLCSMTMLPAIHLTASDLNGPLVGRGLLHGREFRQRYFFARQLSSAILIMLMLIFPLFFNYFEKVIGYNSGENMWLRMLLLLIGIILIASAFSSFGFLIAVLCKRPDLSLWSAFYSILMMAFLSGAFLSEGQLEPWLLRLGLLFPFRSAMNVILHTLFIQPMNVDLWVQNVLRLAGMSIVFGFISYCLIRKRDKT